MHVWRLRWRARFGADNKDPVKDNFPKWANRHAPLAPVCDAAEKVEWPLAPLSPVRLLKIGCLRLLRSPNGATVNSQGRKPLGRGHPNAQPRRAEGATDSPIHQVTIAPLGLGSSPVRTQGLTPLAIDCRPVGALADLLFQQSLLRGERELGIESGGQCAERIGRHFAQGLHEVIREGPFNHGALAWW
jgi:hypothetical protein